MHAIFEKKISNSICKTLEKIPSRLCFDKKKIQEDTFTKIYYHNKPFLASICMEGVGHLYEIYDK